ncbi:MAG TPA: hypothetical protein PLH45_08640, partial [Synergistales bacterium]|nr:hypothetical protein [Synergistales bacterium]
MQGRIYGIDFLCESIPVWLEPGSHGLGCMGDAAFRLTVVAGVFPQSALSSANFHHVSRFGFLD